MALAAYAPSLRYGFVYEDLNDPDTFFHLSVGDVIRSAPKMPFRIIPRTIWAACLQIGHGSPAPYHAVSIAVHLLNGVLLYALLGGWAGVIAAGVLWLHPLQVESVAYISSLPDALAATGVLIALIAAARWPWAVWVGLAFAVLSKESGIVAAALIPLWAVCTGKRWSRAVWATWAAFGALWAVIVIWRLAEEDALAHLSSAYTLTQIAIVGQFTQLVCLPVGLTIDHDYAHATPVIGLFTLALGAALCYWRDLRFAVLWIGLSFLPRLLFQYGDGMHEHHWSVAMIGVALASGQFFARPSALPAFAEAR